MVDYLIHIVFLALLIALAFLVIEVKDLLRALALFIIMSSILSVIFYFLNAPYIAVFQLAIYAGAIAVLFLATLHTMRGRVLREKLNLVTILLLVGMLLAMVLAFSINLVEALRTITPSQGYPLEEAPYFLWTYRGFDIIVQGFLLLATVTAVTAILRKKEGVGVIEEAVEEDVEK
ncbi:MAG: NADH-quinone oxidoreductase subunit J [archaeon]|nr:NADH-quinone oxidoreductase subunit J [archaeon]